MKQIQNMSQQVNSAPVVKTTKEGFSIELAGKSVSYRWNSSMRFKQFQTVNNIQDEQAARAVYDTAVNAHKTVMLKVLQAETTQLGKMNESAVYKNGTFMKRVTVSAITGLVSANERHLIDTWVEKRNENHAKSLEKALIWKASTKEIVQPSAPETPELKAERERQRAIMDKENAAKEQKTPEPAKK